MGRPTNLVLRRQDLTLLAKDADDEHAPDAGCRQETLDADLDQRLAKGSEPETRMEATADPEAETSAPAPAKPFDPEVNAVTHEDVAEAPVVVESVAEPKKTPPPATSKRREERPPRDFIVAYDGMFIGHYRSSRWVSSQAAFKVVARELQQGMEMPLDLELLDLYKPTALKFRKPRDVDGVGDGKFSWFQIEE